MNNAYHLHSAALANCAACNGSCLDGACECCIHDEAPAHPAEACTELGAEPRGKHRDSAIKRFALWLRRVLG